jgi:phage terminase large subunit-like protein
MGDMTHRAVEALRKIDILLCEDTRETAKLTQGYGISAQRLAYHEHNAEKMRPRVLDLLRDGKALGESLRKIAPGIAIRYVPAVGDKFIRSQPSAAAWNAGRIRVPADARTMRSTTDDDLASFVRVVTGFSGMGDREDDDVDALAHAWAAATSSAAPSSGNVW